MSTDVRLDENGNPNLSNGKDYVTGGVDELRQSLEMRLLSQVGWAVDDVDLVLSGWISSVSFRMLI